MSNMAPNEEQLITGNAMASWQVMDPVEVGDVLTLTVTDVNGPHVVTYTVQPSDLNPAANITNPAEASPTFSVALNAATALNKALNVLGYGAQGVMPADLFSPQYFPPYFGEILITGPTPFNAFPQVTPPFTIAASNTGTTNFIVGQQCYPSPIGQSIQGVPLYGYVPIIDAIQMRVPSSDLTLWIDTADVVKFRKDEVRARVQLYRTMCEMMSRDLGGQEYIEFVNKGAGGGGAIA